MRIHINTSPNKESVPFDFLPKLVGVLHKWLGNNSLHGNVSLYSFSWLMHAKRDEKGLNYPDGAKMFVSFYDECYLKQVLKNILHDPDMFYGMRVKDVVIQEDPNLADRELFWCGSPVFIRRHEEDSDTHYTYESELAGDLLKETLLYKMKIAGLPIDETLQIRFDTTYLKKKIKLVDYRGIKNKVNHCPVIIQGRPETKAFAWNVGLGNSTGIGFGSIY
ncbi:CRISPR-associated endoribonuclease Cas6 [Parabacteroides sp. OttesenSCG-928-G07]|nr:CRISPR-associated endoribonuclease Cas6 [Parabacteroides sp. OttesenSCG-928-G07]